MNPANLLLSLFFERIWGGFPIAFERQYKILHFAKPSFRMTKRIYQGTYVAFLYNLA